MGLWQRHRQRQAGKYARRSYRLARREAKRTAAMRRTESLATRANVPAQLPAGVPPRPDLPIGS